MFSVTLSDTLRLSSSFSSAKPLLLTVVLTVVCSVTRHYVSFRDLWANSKTNDEKSKRKYQPVRNLR